MDLQELLIAAILFFAVSTVFVNLAKWLRLGAIFGFLVAGVALGPHSPGPVLTTDVEGLLGIGELGVVLLMFTIGLEMQPGKLWAMRRLLFGLGPAQVLATGAAIALAVQATTGLAFNAALVIGFGLALSSTAIIIPLLSEKGEAASEPGKATFAVLVMQDLASVLLMILVPFLAVTPPVNVAHLTWWEQAGLAVAAIAGVVVLGRYLLPLLFSWAARGQSTAMFGVTVLTAVVAAALAMDEAGLSMAMGTFGLGVMLSASDFRHQVAASVLPLKGLFLALFFVSVGMSIDIRLAVAEGWVVLAYVLQVILIKVVVMAGLGLVFGLDRAGTIRAAFLLAPCSEFGFVLFAMAETGGLLSEYGFAIAVIVVSLSMAATPFTVKLGYGLAARLGSQPKAEQDLESLGEGLHDHVVVAGYARSGRLMSMMLEATGTPYVAVDLDLEHVRRGRAEGHNVYFGDVTNPEIQATAALAKAKSVVVTLEDMDAAAGLVDRLRQLYPSLPIQLAAPDLSTQDAMRARGVVDAICTHLEGNLRLGSAMLRAAGVAESSIDDVVDALRQNDYALLRSSATKPLDGRDPD